MASNTLPDSYLAPPSLLENDRKRLQSQMRPLDVAVSSSESLTCCTLKPGLCYLTHTFKSSVYIKSSTVATLRFTPGASRYTGRWWWWRRRRGAAAPAGHLLPAVVQAAGGLLHRHAAEQAVAAQGVAGALPAGAQLAGARPRPLRPACRQPGRPAEAPGEDKEQQAVKEGMSRRWPRPQTPLRPRPPHLTHKWLVRRIHSPVSVGNAAVVVGSRRHFDDPPPHPLTPLKPQLCVNQ